MGGSKGERTRTRILDAAQEIVLSKGFSGASIDEIIAAAGITKGGFFYHFRGKADLARELMRRYLEQDELFFRAIIDRADELVEDPLQRALLFLKLFSEEMLKLPDVHPGCLVASFTYESQQLDPDVREMAAQGVQRWRQVFGERFRPIVGRYPSKLDVEIDDLADNLISVIEGGIVVSRGLGDPRVVGQQVFQ
jgi:AcrR family transcriptional regulator